MQLSRDANPAGYSVRRVEPGAITINDSVLDTSFFVHADGLHTGWSPRNVDELDPEAMAPALAESPEVILLGSGPRQRFPSPAVMAACLARGVGIEVMDNAAAARTYNVLAAEGRRVLAAFLLPG